MAPNTADATALAEELARYRVVAPERVNAVLAAFRGRTAGGLAEALVRAGVLTPFQAAQTLAGEARMLALGPYRLTAPAGAMGGVFNAIHTERPGIAYRVRVLPLRSLWRAREAKQLVRRLVDAPHRLLVPLADADSANGYHYIVWPRTEGEVLADRVARDGPLSPSETAGLLAHLAEALHACHIRGVTHGAVTPWSVALAADGLPRLLELGAGDLLAANLADDSLLDTMSSATIAGEVVEYGSPEFAAVPTPTPANDQYALGSVGYFALSGQGPFPGMRLAERLAAKQAAAPARLDAVNRAVPRPIAEVIDRMLQPAAADRFSDLDEVERALAALAGSVHDRPTTDPRDPVPDSLRLAALRFPPETEPSGRWQTPAFGNTDFPVRDDSEASVNFELPDPVAEVAAGGLCTDHTPAQAAHLLEAQVSGFLARPAGSPAGPLVPTGAAPSPPSRTSPVLDDPKMAKPQLAATKDPRKGLEAPVHYHTELPAVGDQPSGIMPAEGRTGPESSERPPEASPIWKKLRRNLLFWQAPRDIVQVSVFGPPALTPGQPARVTVFLHGPDAADSVRTLSRAFHHDSELIGSGFVAREVPRDSEVAVHMSVVNAGVSKSLMKFIWRGQPQRLVFDLHVPWEAPSGAAPGLISVGRDEVRIGKVEFRLHLLPRKG